MIALTFSAALGAAPADLEASVTKGGGGREDGGHGEELLGNAEVDGDAEVDDVDAVL